MLSFMPSGLCVLSVFLLCVTEGRAAAIVKFTGRRDGKMESLKETSIFLYLFCKRAQFCTTFINQSLLHTSHACTLPLATLRKRGIIHGQIADAEAKNHPMQINSINYCTASCRFLLYKNVNNTYWTKKECKNNVKIYVNTFINLSE